MRWISVEFENSKNKFRNSNGIKWEYITKEELLIKYPNGGYRVIADMKRKESKNYNLILENNGKITYLFPFRNKINYWEKVIGYIKVNDKENKDTYVRILSFSWVYFILPPFFTCLIIIFSWIYIFSERNVPNLDNTAVFYHIDGTDNKDPDNTIALPGISVITAESNNPKVEFPLYNPSGNQCYMKYKIYDEDGVILFESGLIEPGKAVKEFIMNKSFISGSYKIRVLVEARDINDYKISLNQGEILAELYVE